MIDLKSEVVNHNKSKGKASWKLREVDWENYKNNLYNFYLLEDECNETEVDSIEQNLKKLIINTANNCIGKTKGKSKQKRKSWGTAQIDLERKKRNKYNRRCKQLRKQGYDNQLDSDIYKTAWEEYRNQQAFVKKLIQKARAQEDRRILGELQDKGEIGGKKWYKYLRGEDRALEDISEIIIDGKSITDHSQIKVGIQKFWENIGKCNDDENNLVENIDMKIGTFNLQDMDMTFSKTKISSCLNKMKDNKAPGLDTIPYEMYKYGGDLIVEKLYKLFDIIMKNEKVPTAWNKCKIKLIHKGHNKNKKELKNYRPIALIDTDCKIFCSLLNDSIIKIIEENKVLGEEQQGFRRDRRGEDNIFILNEIIEMHKQENKSLYVCYIDIEKAYDKVNRKILIKVIEKIGMPSKVVNIIRSLYLATKAIYVLGDIETEWADIHNGVRQGCVMSPTLFNLYTEELATRIRRSEMGVNIGNEKLGLLMYADDLVIMAETPGELQCMLKLVEDFGNDFEVKYSIEKTKVMCINSVLAEEISLAGNILQLSEKYKYLGVNITKQGAVTIKADKIYKARQYLGRIASMAKFRTSKYEIVRGLWKTVGVPALMYAAGVISWTKEDLNKIECIQNDIGRVALGASRFVGTESIRGETRWSTFEERIMKSVIIYKKRIENMKEERIVKKIYYMYSNKTKWQKTCSRYIKLCEYRKMFVISLDGNIQPGYKIINQNSSSLNWSYNVGKKNINAKVQEIGLKKWRDGIAMKETLNWYSHKHCPKHEIFYIGDEGSSLLYKCRT